MAFDAAPAESQTAAGHRPVRVAAGAFIYNPRSHKFLLMRRADWCWSGGVWSIPGGSCDPGEMFYQAAARETWEETGHDLEGPCLGPLFFHARTRREGDVVVRREFTTCCHTTTQHFRPTLNCEHSRWGWFGFDDLPQNLHDGVRDMLKSPMFYQNLDRILQPHTRAQPSIHIMPRFHFSPQLAAA